MLHPSLATAEARDALRARWDETGSLRITPFLDDDTAQNLLGALRAQAHALTEPSGTTFQYLYWIYGFVPETTCDHVLCRFGRWLFEDGAQWLSHITGLVLAPPENQVLMATLYSKGSYLDAHNDYDGARRVAYVLGLSPGSWLADSDDHGGWLEFLAAETHAIRVTERRPPGWNSLDLFDVRAPVRLHQVPIMTRDAERRAITGWFY